MRIKSRSLLRTSYWIGAVADFINGITMVYPPFMARMLGLERTPDSLDFRLALLMGASLMFGWAVLLLWADRKPVERKAILLITIFPVITGLAATTVFGVCTQYIPVRGAIPVWILQAVLTGLFLTAYLSARDEKEKRSS